MNFVISQISGGIALLLVCISYFLKNKSTFLIIQIISNLFYGASFIFMGSLVAGLITLVSIFRCFYIYFCEKFNFKYTAYYLPIFFCFYIILGILFWKSWFDIIPICTSIMFTFGFYIKNLQLMRFILIFPNALIMIYCILCKTYTNAILDFIELSVIIVSIIYFIILNRAKQDKAYKIIKNILLS